MRVWLLLFFFIYYAIDSSEVINCLLQLYELIIIIRTGFIFIYSHNDTQMIIKILYSYEWLNQIGRLFEIAKKKKYCTLTHYNSRKYKIKQDFSIKYLYSTC